MNDDYFTGFQEEKFFAALIANGETISANSFDKISDDGEILIRFFTKSKAEIFSVQIGTENEKIFTLNLFKKTFSSGKTGFAAKETIFYKDKPVTIRANLVKQKRPYEYGVTIGLKEQESDSVSLPWAEPVKVAR